MRLLPFLGSSSLLFLLQYFLSQGQSFFQLRLKIYFHFGAKKLLPKVFSHCPMVYSVNLFHVCDQNVEHSKTESDVWSYWKWSCLREGAWLCQDSQQSYFCSKLPFFGSRSTFSPNKRIFLQYSGTLNILNFGVRQPI